MSAPPALIGLMEQVPGDGWTLQRRQDFIDAFILVLDFCVPVTDEDN